MSGRKRYRTISSSSEQTYTNWLGTGSAAVLGYIHGGVRGGYKAGNAMHAYLNKNKKQKMESGGYSTVNMLAHRVSMKRSGRSNLHSIRGNHKYIKVSSGFRDKVEKVMTEKAPYGCYATVRHGAIALTNPINDTGRTTIVQGGYDSSEIVAITTGGTEERGDGRYWQQSMYQNQTFAQGNEFQYFTPLKFLDAASVLWNNKAIVQTYGSQGGNFTNSVTLSTGAPITGNARVPDKKGVDLHVINSYVTWEMKNTSQRTMKLEIYHCVPKVKFPEHLPLETFDSAIAALQQDDLTAGTIRSNNQTDIQDELITSTMLEPNMLEPFSTTYKYEKVTVVINAGETFTHHIQGPKNYDINFSKLYEGEEDMGGRMYNKTSLCAMVALSADLVYATAGAGGATTSNVGRWTARGLGDGFVLKDVIAIEVKEIFKMTMPDDTGFMLSTSTAGAQTLNLKRDMKAFGNFTGIETQEIAYKGADEEQPDGEITMSATM